jgi:hypothetical protein
MLAVMAASRARASPAKCCLHRHDDAEGDAARGRHGDLLERRELLAHALEEARFRQESCFRMWFSVGGHSLANPGQQRLEDGAVPVRDGGHPGDRLGHRRGVEAGELAQRALHHLFGEVGFKLDDELGAGRDVAFPLRPV